MSDAILDTSVLIDLLRGFQPAREWFEGQGRHRIAITPVVWMETVQGARDGARRAQAIRLLRQFHVEHPTEADNRWAMRQTARFQPQVKVDSDQNEFSVRKGAGTVAAMKDVRLVVTLDASGRKAKRAYCRLVRNRWLSSGKRDCVSLALKVVGASSHALCSAGERSASRSVSPTMTEA